MGLVPNSQSFPTLPSGDLTNLLTPFQNAMDTVLTGLGRDITVHLPPAQLPCTDPNCQFDSFYKQYRSTNGQICQTCRGQGFFVEPRFTIYIANIRWTNEPFNNSTDIQENAPVGRLGANFVRVKTVIASRDHIRTSIGATIDGIPVELFREERPTGWAGQLLYIITWWKVVNR